MMQTVTASTLFEIYHPRIEALINKRVNSWDFEGALKEASAYALLSKGKRLRPLLVFVMAEALDLECDISASAYASECFHTASLIADDLPCMDDELLRRGQPSLHLKFGEDVALLASYALLAEGYNGLAENGKLLQQTRPTVESGLASSLALESAATNSGMWGAAGGQFYDLHPPDLTEKSVLTVIHWKTISLFESSLAFGWLFGGGDPDKLDAVKRCAYYFGLAFQLIDDLDDQEQDAKNKRLINFANLFGAKECAERAKEALQSFEETIAALHVKKEGLLALSAYLKAALQAQV